MPDGVLAGRPLGVVDLMLGFGVRVLAVLLVVVPLVGVACVAELGVVAVFGWSSLVSVVGVCVVALCWLSACGLVVWWWFWSWCLVVSFSGGGFSGSATGRSFVCPQWCVMGSPDPSRGGHLTG